MILCNKQKVCCKQLLNFILFFYNGYSHKCIYILQVDTFLLTAVTVSCKKLYVFITSVCLGFHLY